MNKEDKKGIIEHVARYTLIALLVVVLLGSVFVSTINPEAYLFGEKLSGTKAVFFLSFRGIIGVLIAYLLFERKHVGDILSVLYFAFFVSETLITNIISGLGLSSPLNSVGLAFSIILLGVKEFS